MHWPHARFRRARNLALDQRLAEARRSNPESEAWLGLLAAALGESHDGAGWDAAVPALVADRPVKAPLLAHTHITVAHRPAHAWGRRLLKRAAPASAGRLDAVALLEAAVDQDHTRIDALAATAGADAQVVRVVAQLAALPLLQACARHLAAALPPTWWEGYCPVCGAWPVVAEYVGLERKRQLRCGRCGTGWAVPLLRCVFCDETDHEALGYLTPEGSEQMRKVEVCNSCKGYLKALTTVRPLATWEVLLDDLASVPLDVAALERGYHRPERPGYALEARLAARQRRWLGFALGPHRNGG
jgi:FdhE protein